MMNIEQLKASLNNMSVGNETLDVNINALFNEMIVKPYPISEDFGPHDRWQFWSKDEVHYLGNESKFSIIPCTRSVDASITMFKKYCINWRYNLTDHGYDNGIYSGGPGCYFYSPWSSGPITIKAFAKTEALSFSLALVKFYEKYNKIGEPGKKDKINV